MLWIVDVDLDTEVVLLIKYSAFTKYLGKTVNTVRQFVRLVGLKKACDSVRRKVLCNVVFEFGNTMKLVMLIKVCLNETCSRFRIGKHLCGTFLPV